MYIFYIFGNNNKKYWRPNVHKNILIKIRESIQKNVGSNVELIYRSRRKEKLQKGVIEGAYTSLFTIVVQVDGEYQRFSYTYADVLTNAVSLKAIS